MSKNGKETIRTTALVDPKVPGRTVGFSVMTLMIVFVAVFMSQQSDQTDVQIMDLKSALDSADLDGFRSDAWFLPDDSMFGFVEIPAGVFTMGSNPALDRMAYENERWSDTRRQGSIDLPTYFIARYEVTAAQFMSFLQETGSSIPITKGNSLAEPVTNTTWPDALAYARWLEEKLRLSTETPEAIRQLLNDGGHVTLPNEAEWEKAARGSNSQIFPWGSQVRNDLANFNSDRVLPVGSIDCDVCANELSDMSGNVWELTRSPMRDYPFNRETEGINLSDDALFVMRGGSYADEINNVRTAVRGAVDPGVRNPSIGFRLVITPN